MNILQKSYIRSYLNKNERGYNRWVIALLLFCLMLTVILSIMLGATKISLSQIISALVGTAPDSPDYQIIRYVRIPRTIAAVMAGAALSVSGLILQAVFHNSLASPNIIGVNAGAGLAIVIVAALFPLYYNYSVIAAFIGALMALLLIWLLAVRMNATKMTILLSGIAASSFLGAITDSLLTLFPDAVISRQSFLIGGFSGVSMKHLTFAGFFILPALLVILIIGSKMDLLSLGEEHALSLGLNVKLYRFVLLLLAAVLAGGSISFSGLLGFIGLIIPHCARFLVGNQHKTLLPVCILLGSFFTLVCDLVARRLFAPYEFPVGIILSFLGGPFFLLLLYKKRGHLND